MTNHRHRLALCIALGALLLTGLGACDASSNVTAPPAWEPTLGPTVLQRHSPDPGFPDTTTWFRPAVRVSDQLGRAVPNVTIDWRITSGTGDLANGSDRSPAHVSSVTNSDGIAGVDVRFTSLGAAAVQASVAGRALPPATFTATVVPIPAVVVVFAAEHDCGGSNPVYANVKGKLVTDLSVSVGSVIAFEYRMWPRCAARIRSLTAPSDSAHYDSGLIESGARVLFVPTVPGTWQFVEADTYPHTRMVSLTIVAKDAAP